jgi:hypothetical protein
MRRWDMIVNAGDISLCFCCCTRFARVVWSVRGDDGLFVEGDWMGD